MYQLVIIDDEPIIVEGLKNAIDWEGFDLNIALASTDPIHALEFVLKNDINIVITDISMPTLSGLDFIQKLKSVRPSIYIVVLSAFGNFEYTRTALRSGAENYLLKPLDTDELYHTISQIIGHMEEREVLNSLYGHSMLTFRSAFTEQWVKNLLSSNDFISKTELLGINLNVADYTVMIFTSKDRNSSIMSKFLDFLLEKIIGIYIASFYFETPSKLVCVISSTQAQVNLDTFIESVVYHIILQRYRIFISVGSTVDNYSKVYISYNEACSISILEYTDFYYYKFKSIPSMSEDIDYKLADYININTNEDSLIRDLYLKYPTLECTLYIVNKVISNLCKNEYDLPDKFKGLVNLLHELPTNQENSKEHIIYILDFLKATNDLIIKTQQSMYPVVESAIKIINNFADKEISLKTLAQRLNVTPSYLGTLFHQQTGYYFNDYLSNSRLKIAADLIENSDLKIKEIVDKIGFSSQTYFNRAFKRYFNTSPVNYRRDKKLDEINRTLH